MALCTMFVYLCVNASGTNLKHPVGRDGYGSTVGPEKPVWQVGLDKPNRPAGKCPKNCKKLE
ncbi:MAG: hypothetical protein WDA68_07555 [Phycisphaerae bacterium]